MVQLTPARVALARFRRGLTQAELATAIGVTSRTIREYEGGEEPTVSEERLAQLAAELRFPATFFSRPAIDPIAQDAASFRSLSSMTAGQRNAALASGALAVELHEYFQERFKLPGPSVPDLREHGDPEQAAATLRGLWELGQRPLRNVLHLTEAHGVRVFSLTDGSKEVDAFSFWREGTPYIFLNTTKSPTGERGRFDVAHELGHLVLHQHAGPSGRDAEEQADLFAAAFLMPRADVLAHAPRLPSLPTLIELKKRWGVSLAALVVRLHRLGLLSDWQYRTLFIQMGERGYRKAEPQGLPRESSQVWRKVLQLMREDGVSVGELARRVHLPAREVASLAFGVGLVGDAG